MTAIQKVGTHTLRHTFRSWLDAAGTRIAVQTKLMRHADIRTTMNTYGPCRQRRNAPGRLERGAHGAWQSQLISGDFGVSNLMKSWRREWDATPG
jgi:integrase